FPMKLPWLVLCACVVWVACSAPSRAMKPSASLPPSSGTSLFAATKIARFFSAAQADQVPGSPRTCELPKVRRFSRGILVQPAVQIFSGFLARTLRRRAGSAGVPWPLSEAPRLSFLKSGGWFTLSLEGRPHFLLLTRSGFTQISTDRDTKNLLQFFLLLIRVDPQPLLFSRAIVSSGPPLPLAQPVLSLTRFSPLPYHPILCPTP